MSRSPIAFSANDFLLAQVVSCRQIEHLISKRTHDIWLTVPEPTSWAGPEGKVMSITVEQAVEATPEVYDLIVALNRALSAAYEAHQRHGLSIEQLFQPNVRFFLARLDGLAVGCGGVAMFDDYAGVERMYIRPAARGRGIAKALLRRRPVQQASSFCASKQAPTNRGRSVSTIVWDFGHEARSAPGPYAAMPARNIETSLFFEKTLS